MCLLLFLLLLTRTSPTISLSILLSFSFLFFIFFSRPPPDHPPPPPAHRQVLSAGPKALLPFHASSKPRPARLDRVLADRPRPGGTCGLMARNTTAFPGRCQYSARPALTPGPHPNLSDSPIVDPTAIPHPTQDGRLTHDYQEHSRSIPNSYYV